MNHSLLLVRHAMANEKEGDQKDIDRTLNNNGLRDATRIGQELKKKEVVPDIIISSPAVRARATAELIAEKCGYSIDKIHINDEVYNAPVRVLLQTINRCKEEWNIVLIVAHNPGVSYVAEYITGDEIGSVPPGTMLHLDFEVAKWEEISAGSGSVTEKIYPESLSNE